MQHVVDPVQVLHTPGSNCFVADRFEHLLVQSTTKQAHNSPLPHTGASRCQLKEHAAIHRQTQDLQERGSKRCTFDAYTVSRSKRKLCPLSVDSNQEH
jgi:hypothetical protein